MLTIKCAGCKSKLWKYDKIGQGEVLRCHKDRISKVFSILKHNGKVSCHCGMDIATDMGTFYKMISKSFTYKGTKRS
ncbi:MAG: hypothetical protein OEZ36_03575 [Spirochaetota bacterium]|nr:hypothetical protein [Spirochaetota bacterium]